MNLYLISHGMDLGYDAYYSAVVVAEDEVEAAKIHPNGDSRMGLNGWYWTESGIDDDFPGRSWVYPDSVKVILLGKAEEGLNLGDVVCANFRAG